MEGAKISKLEDVKKFLLAGHALFTLVSKRTGERKTFEVKSAEKSDGTFKNCFFVGLLTGPENTSDYRYLGFLYERNGAHNLKPNRHGWGEEAINAFAWLLRCIDTRMYPGMEEGFSKMAEVWHAGRCGRCGKTLTDPESIERGLGPKCAGME